MRTVKTEFPDFDGPELDIPPFTPEPWHNDACPRYSWREGVDELTLWTDYADPAKRECDGPQYLLVVSSNEEQVTTFEGETIEALREALNAWYEQSVGYRPDDDLRASGQPEMPLGELMSLVGAMAILTSHD